MVTVLMALMSYKQRLFSLILYGWSFAYLKFIYRLIGITSNTVYIENKKHGVAFLAHYVID
jgi:hypothetical protein